MDYYSCLTCVPSLKMQALFSAKQETASGIYPASGITPSYLMPTTLKKFFFSVEEIEAQPSQDFTGLHLATMKFRIPDCTLIKSPHARLITYAYYFFFLFLFTSIYVCIRHGCSNSMGLGAMALPLFAIKHLRSSKLFS